MISSFRSVFNLFTLFVLLLSQFGSPGISPALAAGTLFVKPAAAGSGDCSSWANACTLQTAITNSVSGDQIWVVAGTHKPHASDRTVSFTLKNGVAIYGGFAGTETLLSQRNPAVNVTILSGDLNGNDSGFTNNGENSYHVVVGSGMSNTAVLDGFTISGGNANGVNPSDAGGGMYNNAGSPALTNVTFSANSAAAGGGIYNSNGNPTLTNVTFSANSASNGGGMYNINNSNPTLTNVTFSANSTSVSGGGMYSSNSSPILTNVTFSANSASVNGGGVYNQNSSSPILRNVIIANNSGGDCVNNSSTLNVASSNNLIEDASNACGLTNGTNGNIIGSDPNLGVLVNNGGSTQTFALLAGSPVIDKGIDTGCPATDQRGVTRPFGGHCDIGAYEYSGTQAGPNFVVNTVADTNGYCDLPGQGTGNKDCTLREAINAANAFPGADTITFAANYTITLVASQLPAVTTQITIIGNGPANTIVQANANPNTDTYRVFNVSGGGNLTLDRLTVQNGSCYDLCGGGNGGGILNDGTLTVTNSTFSENHAALSGGGILNNSILTVTNSTFSENGAYDPQGIAGGVASGGGIYNNGTLIVTNSTFSGNTAALYGGGIFHNNGTVTMMNSTLSGNGASYGGGMANNKTGVSLTNAILANNSGIGDCQGSLNAASGNNLIEGTGTNACGLTNGVNGNIIGQDPKLDVLANNGGPTQSFALLSGSPAIDTGADAGCPATDQRGVTRPQRSHCDIGSYELPPATFGDVADNYWAWQYIERLYNAGITGGCSTSPLSYCPTNPVTRAQMAVFLEKGIHGSSFTPPNVSPTFTDTVGNFAEDWIEALKNDGVTSGCGTGIYCPDATVTRAQMAVFLLKAKHGSAYIPPNATGVFTDVPVGYWADKWIEQLAAEGITSGCAAGLYCPESPVTRDQMAVFLVKAFNLP